MGSRFTWAPSAYKLLNGVFCIYKPSGMSLHKAVQRIKQNLTDDLNALPCYEYEIPLRRQAVAEDRNMTFLSTMAAPTSMEDWSEHRLVLGQRYEPTDFRVSFVDGISSSSTGVVVLGIGPFARRSMGEIALAKYLRVYHVKGRFGWATDDFTASGKILLRAKYKHITRYRLDRLCAAVQGAYTKQMYELSGIDPTSQEAYELAKSGLLRPTERGTSPVLYGVKCVDFQSPDFTLEIFSINEQTYLLQRLVHDMAIRLRTAAVCTGLRRLRYGYFDTDRALVRQEWRLDKIIDNIKANHELMTPEKLDVGVTTRPAEMINERTLKYLPTEEEEDFGRGLVCNSGVQSQHSLTNVVSGSEDGQNHSCQSVEEKDR